MATRSFIAIKEKDTFKAVYHHSESYHEYLGRLLLEHYSDVDKVREAISFGDASIWKENIHPPKDKLHDFDDRHPDVSVFYNRDRGDTECDCTNHATQKALILDAYNSWAEYLYIFNVTTNKWSVVDLRLKNETATAVLKSIKELGDDYE